MLSGRSQEKRLRRTCCFLVENQLKAEEAIEKGRPLEPRYKIMAAGEDKSGYGSSGGVAGGADRKARLAEALRANLQRRKAQARSRRQGAADARPDGLSTDRHKKD